jgi:hypothetical protein
MSQLVNQFGMSPEKGQIAFGNNPNVVNARILSSSVDAATILPGAAMKLVDATSKEIIVDKAAAGDRIFGFVKAQNITNVYAAGDIVEVCYDGTIMHMETNAAVTLGALLEIVAATNRITPSLGTNTIIGLSLRKAAAAAEIIPVLIRTPLVNQVIAFSSLPAISFLDLSDTPNVYTSGGLKNVRVNTGATALEFHATAFIDLSDVPVSYSGAGSKTVKVNSGATALEFVTVV